MTKQSMSFKSTPNRHVDTVGEGEGGTNWEIRFAINTLPCVK